ncbi:hypothetical protein HHK36_029748 [Tetracentron sinense]|uniref:Uncharacterized protein n=1 Tax=Tetracentron sinense TaxID=13715 RepID=A0A834YBV8_TETSI|nr:hypothetical protein HHK36_029748 [Tetracentron sinense]
MLERIVIFISLSGSLMFLPRQLHGMDFLNKIASTIQETGEVVSSITGMLDSHPGSIINGIASISVYMVYIEGANEDEVASVITFKDVIFCFFFEPLATTMTIHVKEMLNW